MEKTSGKGYAWSIERMLLVRAINLFLMNAVWRLTSLRFAGRVLVEALGAKQETVRMIAATLLTKAGKRSLPLLREAVNRRENLQIVLTIIGDVGGDEYRQELEQFTRDNDPQVAKSAQYALRVLTARQSGA